MKVSGGRFGAVTYRLTPSNVIKVDADPGGSYGQCLKIQGNEPA
jgi:hypothetical protein